MVGGFRIKDHQFEQRMFLRRTLVAALLISLASFTLVGRLVLLQIVRNDYYTELSLGNRARIEPIPANRGLIMDRHGAVLAENQPAYQLELVREQVPDLDGTLKALSTLGLIAPQDIPATKRLVMSRRGFEGVPIRLRLDEEEIARFAVHRYKFPGVDIRTRLTRYYPFGELAVHALGYVAAISEQDLTRIDRTTYTGTTLIGKLGVESARETELHGQNGFREILVNAQGRSVEPRGNIKIDLRSRAPKAGQDLLLGIDLATQKAAEEGLADRRGAVVAIDPSNGDVIALASRPGFDPSMFGRGLTQAEYTKLTGDIDLPLLNRAIRGIYPPGSTVKPVIAMAGLSYGIVTAHEVKYCTGQYHIPNSRRTPREGRGGVHGYVALEAAIAESCDVYFYGLAFDLGVDKLHEFLDPFGFGKLTGIDISGEKTGLLPSREWKQKQFKNPADKPWFPGESVNFGIGQGYMTVTPVQLAQYTAVLAAKGKVFRPRLVTGMRDSETHVIQHFTPERLPDVKGGTADHWQTVFNGMVGTVNADPAPGIIKGGTAKAIRKGAYYTIAGKTGTAQVFSVAANDNYYRRLKAMGEDAASRLRDHSWFIAFAPAENPRIAMAVIVENGGFGAGAAAPIARKVMDAYLLPLGIGVPPPEAIKPGSTPPAATPTTAPAPATAPAATASARDAGHNPA